MNKIIVKTIQVHIARFNTNISDFEYLILKRNENERLYPGIWQAVTGTIEENENTIRTAQREVKEETNLNFSEIYAVPFVTSFYDSKYDAIQMAPVFGMIADFKDEVIISEEHTDFKWAKFDECVALIALPSHKEGTLYFRDYILMAENKSVFLKKI